MYTDEEVVSEATVIVKGHYILPRFIEGNADSLKWIPVKFKVDGYYRGSGSEIIDTALLPVPLERVKEFQDKNGEFILFLDGNQIVRLYPVGSSSGIVKMLNGAIQDEKSTVFNEFIETHELIAPTASSLWDICSLYWYLYGRMYWIHIILPIVLITLLLIFWIRKKRRIKHQ